MNKQPLHWTLVIKRPSFVAVALILAFGQVGRADVENALARLETFRIGDGTPALNESLSAIRTGAAVGDGAVWKRLRAIVENPRIPPRVRTEVLQLAIEKSDENIAKEMLSLFDTWSRQLPTSDITQSASEASEADARITLLGYFVASLRNGSLKRRLGGDPKSFDFLERVFLRTGPGMQINHDALGSLAASDGKPEIQRAVAERLIAASPRNTEHDSRLLGLLDTSSCDRLRALVRKANDPDHFHYGAAAALAHLGDLGIRAELESLVPAFQKKDRNFGGILTYYLWQIDVQNPPTKLLDYIVATPRHDTEKRMWAVRRAVELGLPKPKIREAVLKHASLVQPAGKYNIRQGLSSLKALCIELKILNPGDLPDVAVAQGTPTP